ncbi:low molecular weight phosphotyrosine protein phosphatase [Drosophila eugracilis]|uniref:low molecular weight phosphotyrosine protein phosphatase n=1 Tax=Drosophila eugracilis TaxID=29029 RepID=UPI001BDAA16E|nr:low molecular weight phosphotyrosine protein phosphatase [Drosophila eugracilis]
MVFKKLLFVCMGNSCSSPMAEVIMQNLMVKTSLYWEVDSAGLRTWNIGRRPHKRCLQILREHGLRSDHFCRQFTANDFRYFDYIVAMDEAVYRELLFWDRENRGGDCEVLLLSSFGKNGLPSYIDSLSPTQKLKNFRSAYYRIKECCKHLILSQKVDIVKYELPSTEDEDFYYANKEKESLGGAEKDYSPIEENSKHSGMFLLPMDIRSSGGLTSATDPSCTNASMNHCTQGPQRKLCQKCGQKFLAAL